MESILMFFKKINIVLLMVVFAASLTIGQNMLYAQVNGSLNEPQFAERSVDEQGRPTVTTTRGTVQSGQTFTTVTTNADGSRTQTQRVTSPQSVSSSSAGRGLGGGAGTCLVGQTLANAISIGVTSLIARGTTALAASFFSVPTSDRVTQNSTTDTAANNIAQTSKEVGIPLWGIPILPSLDSIGYCLVNSLIEYISDATIAWINSGFEGNPVFIDNFDQFFKNLADRELAVFMDNLTLPGYMCEQFQVNIQLGLLTDRANQRDRFNRFRGGSSSSSTGGFGRQNQCGLETFLNGGAFAGTGGGFGSYGGGSYAARTNQYPGIGSTGGGGDINSYYAGDQQTVSSAGFIGFLLAGNPQNNSLGAYNAAQRQVAVRQQSKVAVKQFETGVNQGVQSTEDEDGNIQTPGRIIQSQIEKRLGLDEDRLVLAREFDEVVSSLVDALVRIALDEILPGGADRFVNVSVDGRNVQNGQPSIQNPNGITTEVDVRSGGN